MQAPTPYFQAATRPSTAPRQMCNFVITRTLNRLNSQRAASAADPDLYQRIVCAVLRCIYIITVWWLQYKCRIFWYECMYVTSRYSYMLNWFICYIRLYIFLHY